MVQIWHGKSWFKDIEFSVWSPLTSLTRNHLQMGLIHSLQILVLPWLTIYHLLTCQPLITLDRVEWKIAYFSPPTSEEEIRNILKLLKMAALDGMKFQQKLSKFHVVHCWNRYAIYSTYHCTLGCFLMNLNLLRLFLYIKQVILEVLEL